MQRLKDLHLVTPAGQLARAGQPRRPRTNNRYTLTIRRRYFGIEIIFSPRVVSHKTFQLPNRHGLPLHSPNAGPLALSLLRTYAPAHRRQTAVLPYHIRRGEQIAIFNRMYKLGYLNVYRARLHAARPLALQAARCFQPSLLKIITVANLPEIGRPHLWILLSHRHALYLIRWHLSLPLFNLICTPHCTHPNALSQSFCTCPVDASPPQNQPHAHRILAPQRK